MGKSGKIRISLSVKITSMSLAIVILAMSIVGVFSYRFSSKSITNSTNERLTAIVKDISHQIESINQEHFSQLQMLANMDVFRSESLTLEEKQRFLMGLVSRLGKTYNNLAFYDIEGNAITDAGVTINFATRPYFTEAMAGRRYVSIPAFSKVTNSVLQHYSVPVYSDQNKIIGAMVFVINGNSMQSLIEGIDLGEGRTPVILDNKTKAVVASMDVEASEKHIEELSKTGTLIKNILAGKKGVEDYVEPVSNEHLVCAYDLIDGTDWTACAIAPYRYYFRALDQFRIALVAMFVVVAIIVVFVILFSVKAIVKPLLAVKKSIGTIATGNADLTQRIDITVDDEIGDVVKGFNIFVEKLQDIIKAQKGTEGDLLSYGDRLGKMVQENTAFVDQMIGNIHSVETEMGNQNTMLEYTSKSVNEISEAVRQLRELLVTQNEGMQNASSAVTQMIGNIGSVSRSIEKMAEEFNVLQEDVHDGILRQREVNEQIQKIEQQSKMLNDANDVISSIADQTSLLAMNAAIEAAHAGDAGKGFAVVADEIRKLSENSSTQSKNIGSQLTAILNSISSVVEASNVSDKMFTRVSEKIQGTGTLVSQIKLSMDEQSEGSKQISEALGYMNDAAGKVKEASNDVDNARGEIVENMGKLHQSADAVGSELKTIESGVKTIEEGDDSLMNIATSISGSIYRITSQIDQFKV